MRRMESNYFGTAEHAGTHLDAPGHFHKSNRKVHEVPLTMLSGPGIIINVTVRHFCLIST